MNNIREKLLEMCLKEKEKLEDIKKIQDEIDYILKESASDDPDVFGGYLDQGLSVRQKLFYMVGKGLPLKYSSKRLGISYHKARRWLIARTSLYKKIERYKWAKKHTR